MHRAGRQRARRAQQPTAAHRPPPTAHHAPRTVARNECECGPASARRAGRGCGLRAAGRAVSPACHGSGSPAAGCAQARTMHAGKCHTRAVWRAPRASPGMQQQAAGSAAVIHDGTGGWLEDLPAGAQRAARSANRVASAAACGMRRGESRAVVSRLAFRPESAGTPSLWRTGASAPPLSAVMSRDILQSVAEMSADKAARGAEASQTLRGTPCCAVHTAPGATPFVPPLVRAPASASTCSATGLLCARLPARSREARRPGRHGPMPTWSRRRARPHEDHAIRASDVALTFLSRAPLYVI